MGFPIANNSCRNMDYIRSSSQNPCPICGDEGTSCKIFETRVLCFKAEPKDEPLEEGWFYLRDLNGGYGTDWVTKEIKTASAAQRATRASKKMQTLAPVAKKRKNKARSYTVAEYSEIMEHTIELCSKEFNTKWKNSGKVKNSMLRHGVRVLSSEAGAYLVSKGLIPSGLRNLCVGNLLIPMVSTTGRFESAQIRTLPGTSKLRYLWVSNNEHQSHSNTHGETPFQMLLTPYSKNTALFVEGSLKPIGVFQLLKEEYSVIGGVGGQWGHTPETLHEAVEILKARGVTNFLLAADSGSYNNPQVAGHYKKLEDELSKHSIRLQTLDWGQLHDKSAPDADEVDEKTLRAAIAKFDDQRITRSNFHRRVMEPARAYNPFKETTSDYFDLSPEEITEFFRANKYTVDQRPTGAGKTHNIENLHRQNPAWRLIYIAKSPDNYPTEYLAKNATLVTTRNAGRVIEDGVKRAPRAGETPDIPSTCSKTSLHIAGRDKGIKSIDICKACSLYSVCNSGSDPNNNYLLKVKVEDLKNKTLITTSAKSISPRMFQTEEEKKKSGRADVVIIEEFTDLFPPNTLTKLNRSEIDQVIALMRAQDADIQQSRRDKNNNQTLYIQGGDHKKLREILVTEDVKSQQAAVANMHFGNSVHSVSRYTKIFDAIKAGYLYKDGLGNYIINEPNTALRYLMSLADRVILLDATITKAELEAMGLEGFVTLGATNNAVKNQKITVLECEGVGQNKWYENTWGQEVEAALRERFKGVPFVVPCGAAKEGDIGAFRDSRGSNRYEKEPVIVQIGMLFNSTAVVREAYNAFINPTFTFEEYYEKRTIDETVQAMGRQRANQRQGEELNYYIVANVRLAALEAMGYEIHYETIYARIPRLAHETIQLVDRMLSAMMGKIHRTQKELAAAIGRNRHSFSTSIKKLRENYGITLEEIASVATEMLSNNIFWAELSAEATEELKAWDGESPLSEETVFAMERNIFRTGCKGFKMKEWLALRLNFLSKYPPVIDLNFKVLLKHMEKDAKEWGLEKASSIWYVQTFALF